MKRKKPTTPQKPPKEAAWSATLRYTRGQEGAYRDEVAERRLQKQAQTQRYEPEEFSDGKKAGRKKWRFDGVEMVVGKVDPGFFISTVLLIGVGLLMMLSASSYQGSVSGDALGAFRSQAIFAVLGVGVMFVFMAIVDYRVFRFNWVTLGVVGGGIFLLLLLKVLPEKGFIINAPVINGSQRWLRIGSGASSPSIQPSELGKFALVLFLSAVLSKPGAIEKRYWPTMLRCLGVMGVFCLLVMMQPNLSTTIVLAAVSVILMFIAGMKLGHLGLLTALGMAGAYVLTITSDYRSKRLFSFLDPWELVSTDSYQLVQSLYALANGGLFGTGWGMSRQKQMFLPYASSDFIFAIVAEELGYVGSVLILCLFLWQIYCGIRVAMYCPDRFGQLLATGLISLIAVQVIVNVAVVSGMAPTTGLPLPFFTEGGTSLVIFMAEAGILLNISRHRRPTQKE